MPTYLYMVAVMSVLPLCFAFLSLLPGTINVYTKVDNSDEKNDKSPNGDEELDKGKDYYIVNRYVDGYNIFHEVHSILPIPINMLAFLTLYLLVIFAIPFSLVTFIRLGLSYYNITFLSYYNWVIIVLFYISINI